MSIKAAAAEKAKRLQDLETWARRRFESDKWEDPEFNPALQEHLLVVWGVSDSAARNMARIVQLRLLRTRQRKETIPTNVTAQTTETDEKDRPILEIIGDYRKTLPPVPLTNFEVQEES